MMFALALVVVFAAVLASAVFHSVLVADQQRLDRMDQRLEQRQQAISRARLRVAELSSPARVVAAAQRRGMVVPDHTTWLSAGAPTTGTPAGGAAPPAAGGPPASAGSSSGSGSELAAGPTAGR